MGTSSDEVVSSFTTSLDGSKEGLLLMEFEFDMMLSEMDRQHDGPLPATRPSAADLRRRRLFKNSIMVSSHGR